MYDQRDGEGENMLLSLYFVSEDYEKMLREKVGVI